jgi:hypothetical protein
VIFSVAADFINAVSGILFRNKGLFGTHGTLIVCRLSASSAARPEEPTLSGLYFSTSEVHIVSTFVLLMREIKKWREGCRIFLAACKLQVRPKLSMASCRPPGYGALCVYRW